MDKLLYIILTIVFVMSLVLDAHATATSETKDKAARPYSAYGVTSGGDLKPILVDSDGVVQLS